jgi:hypothetical protein
VSRIYYPPPGSGRTGSDWSPTSEAKKFLKAAGKQFQMLDKYKAVSTVLAKDNQVKYCFHPRISEKQTM